MSHGLNDFEIEKLRKHADRIEKAGMKSKEERRKSVVIQARTIGNPGPTDEQLREILLEKHLWDDQLDEKENLSPLERI